MRSRCRSIIVVSALVALAVSVSASAAAAVEPIKFEWKVNGSALKTGSEKETTVKSKSKEVFHLNFDYEGARVDLTSSKVTSKGFHITGGNPGKIEDGKLTFENVEAAKTIESEGCRVKGEKIETVPIKGEIVESATAEKGTGKTEILIEAKEGLWLAQFYLEQIPGKPECFFKEATFSVRGTVLAEMSPQKKEAKSGQLLFGTESSKTGAEYRTAAGKFLRSTLNSAGEWQLIGEPEMELVSKEIFGAF